MNLLVTGGAGYIGSFMTKSLLDLGHNVTVIDNLKRGKRSAVDDRATFKEIDLNDDLSEIFIDSEFDSILHFAGLISVEESTKDPELYFKNNIEGSRNLFETAIKNNVRNFIFSSTAAVYGNPTQIPIPEDHDKKPTSPYGESKLKTERNLIEIRKNDPLVSFAVLRYFNACGASLNGEMGESHIPETHIIPLAIKAIMEGSEFKIFGDDYDTPDGTCLRDYIHVLDLVDAHLLALNKIIEIPGEYCFNVGTGNGISNLEVVEMVKKVSGKDLKLSNFPRRPGDADRLIADPSKIQSELNFIPKYSDLETIINSAWKWHNK